MLSRLTRTPMRRVALIAGFVLFATVAANAAVVLGGETWVFRDWHLFALPSYQYLAESIAALRLPQWCEALGFGIPFAGNPDHRTLYLPFWLMALFPMPMGADLVFVAHFAAGGLGTALLARRWGADALGAMLAGALFATSGYVTSTTVNQMTPMLAWIPWVAWAADHIARALPSWRARLRAALLYAGVISGLAVLGEPSSIGTAVVLSLAIVLARGRSPVGAVAALGAGGLFSLALAAAVTIPAVHLLTASTRAAGLHHEVITQFSMHPLRLVELIWPGALGGPSYTTSLGRLWADSARLEGAAGHPFWAETLFVGAPAVFLAAFALRGRRDLRILAGVTVGLAVVAMGRFTPLYDAFRLVFPPERLARYPEKHIVGVTVLLCALAGVGVARWTRSAPGRLARLGALGSAGAFVLAVAALWLFRDTAAVSIAADVQALSMQIRVVPAAAIDRALGGGLIGVAGLTAFAAAFARTRASVAPWRAALLLAGALLPSIANDWRTNWTAPRELVSATPALLSDMVEPGASARPRVLVQKAPIKPREVANPVSWIAYFHENAVGDVAARFGVAVVSANDSFATPVQETLWGLDWFDAAPLDAARLGGAELALMRSAEARAAGIGIEGIRANDRMALVQVAGVRRRAFVTASWSWVATGGEVPSLVSRADRPLEAVVLTGSGERHAAPAGASSECMIRDASPERVQLRCASTEGGYAVLLDAQAPGWAATVDGVPARIEVADGLFRAVRVGPGVHVVEYRFRTPGLALGLAVSGSSAILFVLGWWVTRRRGRCAESASTPNRARSIFVAERSEDTQSNDKAG
jgi:hypothetical protein